MIRSPRRQKDFRAGAGRTAILQIIQDGFAHLQGHGHPNVLAVLGGLEKDPVPRQSSSSKRRVRNCPPAYPVGGEQLQDGAVPLADSRVALNAPQDFLGLLFGETAWNRGQFVRPERGDRAVQGLPEVARVQGETKESPQGRLHGSSCRSAVCGCIGQDELLDFLAVQLGQTSRRRVLAERLEESNQGMGSQPKRPGCRVLIRSHPLEVSGQQGLIDFTCRRG